MWKVKLDNGLWLSRSGTTTNEVDALLLLDIQLVQEQLKEVRRFTPYPNAMVIFEEKPKYRGDTN